MAATNPEIKELVLKAQQLNHFKKLCGILRKNFAAIDTSGGGCGKTFVTMAIALRYKIKLFVICPKSMIPTWVHETTKYGVELVECTNYDQWKMANHKYLECINGKFYPTPALITLIQSRVLFVFDESQNLKNKDTIQQQACHAVVKCIVEQYESLSRVLLLSATPIDKIEQVCSILQMLAVITEDDLIENIPGSNGRAVRPTGILQLYRKCREWSPALSEKLIPESVDRKNVIDIAINLYTQIVRKMLASSMPKLNIERDAKNGFYKIHPRDMAILARGEAALKRATRYNKNNNKIGEISTWAAITSALILLEKGKLRTMARLALQDLISNPHVKVILYVWHIDHIHFLADCLREYNPLLIYGKIKTIDERSEICRKFQESSDEYRLLISNPTVGGVGLSLDDQVGDRPRHLYITADYRIIVCTQATYRVTRAETKSLAKIRFVYSKDFDGEKSILESLIKKSEVIRSSLADEKDAEFPGNFDKEYEDDVDVEIINSFPDPDMGEVLTLTGLPSEPLKPPSDIIEAIEVSGQPGPPGLPPLEAPSLSSFHSPSISSSPPIGPSILINSLVIPSLAPPPSIILDNKS